MDPAVNCIAHDAIVDLRVDRTLIESDAGSTGSAGFNAVAKTLRHVRLARARLVLECYQKPAGGRLVARRIVVSGPGVDVNHSVRRHHQVPGVTNIVGEYSGAKACG